MESDNSSPARSNQFWLAVFILLVLLIFELKDQYRTLKSDNSSPSESYQSWLDKVDPELAKSKLLQFYGNPNFDSMIKINVAHALLQIPGPVSKGVASKRIEGIGMECFPTGIETGNAALLWIHFGGRIMGSSSGANESAICSRIVNLLNIPVISADYRLAPHHPFPAGLDDLVDSYKWLAHIMTTKQGEKVSNEEKCDARILIAGESSGGGLAAELCQRLVDAKLIYSRDEFEFIPLPAAQLLLNPMLDDRTLVDESTKEIPSHLIWNHTSNLFAWKSYLGPTNKPGQCGLPDYSVAARRVDLSNLSPCWIAIGDSDLFYPECKEYFERLTKSGIEAEYLEIVGGYHGMFNIANGTESKIKNAWESFQKFAIKHLTKEK